MRNVLIFHGTGGNPQGNWFPWLKEELEKKDYKVFVPQFPHPKNHTIVDWFKMLEEYTQYINGESLLIGHSLGGLFLLRVLERLDHKVKGAFFAAASVGIKPILYYESDLKFSGFDFNWKQIKKNAGQAFVYHSDNDPYICLANGEKLAKKLGVKLTFIPNAEHLNEETGYFKFDLLLQDIKSVP